MHKRKGTGAQIVCKKLKKTKVNIFASNIFFFFAENSCGSRNIWHVISIYNLQNANYNNFAVRFTLILHCNAIS